TAGRRLVDSPVIRRLLAYGVAVAATVLVVAVPLLIANPTMALASARSLLARSSWETLWALADGYYGGGVVAPVDQRFDPAAAQRVLHASALPRGAITLGFAAGYLALLALPARSMLPISLAAL